MRFDMIYITPVTVDGASVRKLTFAPQGVDKTDPAYFHASLLAGPWKKQTRICKGTLDGVVIATPFVIPLRLRAGENGEFLVLNGVKMAIDEPVVTPVMDGETKTQRLGADKRPMFNLRGGAFEVTTYVLASGDDDAAFAGSSKAPTAPAATDDEALL